MFDIVKTADELFGTKASFCKEIVPEFICDYKIEKNQLPSTEVLTDFLGLKPERDNIAITITSDTDSTFVGSDVLWMDSYNRFTQGLYKDDELTVSIKVTKTIKDGVLSVYNLNDFSNFLCETTIEQAFEIFTSLFNKCGDHIIFNLLNANGSFRTNTIAFSDNDVQWVKMESRERLLRNCEDASVFLERNRIRLAPQDFDVVNIEGNRFDAIEELFNQLKTVLSYIYLANTATVSNGKAVLQFDPSAKGYEYELTQLIENENVTQIYSWVFKGDACVDKAGIARKIINTYCRSKDSILLIDEQVLNSIKSDYVIYQKNHADQYIEMKNKISEYIVDCAEKIQDLSHDITDAFSNNFVAVIVFLMTVLLTDSIDFSQFLGTEISPKVTAVCGVFAITTLLYYIATIIMGNQKWNWLKQSYGDLKENYKDVFDEADIEEAFKHDKPLNNAENEYKRIRKIISGIWIALILALGVFTGILACQGNRTISEQTQIEVVETETAEREAEEDEVKTEESGEISQTENDEEPMNKPIQE